MNERIEQVQVNEQVRRLAEQAGCAIDRLGYGEGNLEKFAELIVRECANHCDLLLDHKISSEWSRGTHDCSRAIKKHFGVERMIYCTSCKHHVRHGPDRVVWCKQPKERY